MPDNYDTIASKLVDWYANNKRELPWRYTKDPYLIWVSEIMLQQTTVRQGLPYYERFIERFPDVSSLALASEDELLKLWEGLGYYSRARNMHFTAKFIHNDLNGVFPDTYKGLLNLKGVGDYTASAIASIAYDLPFPVVDGNVLRVISRLKNIEEPVDTKAVIDKVKDICTLLIQKQRPSIFNQAIMELGALVCSPRSPRCTSCPIQKYCTSYKLGNNLSLPVKSKKLKKKSRFFNYFIIEDDNSVLLNKRSHKDIWQGLYEFPLVEEDKSQFQRSPKNFPPGLESLSLIKEGAKVYKQTLTHQYIHAQFHYLRYMQTHLPDGYIWVNKSAISGYPFPKIIDLYLKDKSIPLF